MWGHGTNSFAQLPTPDGLSQRQRGQLTVEELQQAETALQREAQRDFDAECLLVINKNQQQIPRKIELHGVNLFIDYNGIMRFRSRNTYATGLSYDARYPIVMPRNHPITAKAMQKYHEEFLHDNTQTVLNELRHMIKRVRTMINRTVKKCQWCKVNRAKPVYPQMASHPIDRLVQEQGILLCGNRLSRAHNNHPGTT